MRCRSGKKSGQTVPWRFLHSNLPPTGVDLSADATCAHRLLLERSHAHRFAGNRFFRMRQQMVAVVDDDPGMLKSIERLLKAYKFRTVVFSSAEAFLAGSRRGCGELPRSRYPFGRDVRDRPATPARQQQAPTCRSFSYQPSTMRPCTRRPLNPAALHIFASRFWRSFSLARSTRRLCLWQASLAMLGRPFAGLHRRQARLG